MSGPVRISPPAARDIVAGVTSDLFDAAALSNGDLLADRHRLDPLTARFEVERTVIRDGRARRLTFLKRLFGLTFLKRLFRLTFLKRLFGFPELRDWFVAAGFTDVAGHGEDGRPLDAGHHRVVVTARLP